MKYQSKARVFSFIVILCMLLSALGIPTQSALAADAGTALQFDGTNDYVPLGLTAELGTPSFTLEAWVKRNAGGKSMGTGTAGLGDTGLGLPQAYPVITKGRGQAELPLNVNMNYWFGIATSGVIAADFEDTNDGLNHPILGMTAIPLGEWHHIAVTYADGCWNVYLDGNPEALDSRTTQCPKIRNSTTVPAVPEAGSVQHAAISSALQSLGNLPTDSGYFSGVIDEARVWNRALSQSEIQANKGGEITSGSGLLARWGMNEGSGTVINSSVGSFPGTLTNGPTWTTGFPIPDGVPPAVPTGLVATPYNSGVSLTWNANMEIDLAGYNLYRGTTPAGPYTKVNTSLITALNYADSGLTNGTQYYYVLRAVDTSNNESTNSAQVSATPQAGHGAGLQFDGTNDYVTFGAASGLGLQTFTVETWFKRTGTGIAVSTGTNGVSAVPLVTKGSPEADGSTVDENYILGIRSTDNVLAADFETYTTCGTKPAGDNNPIVGVTPILNNTWYHAAFTYDGAALKLYLNGNLEATLATTCIPRYDSTQHAGLGTYLTSTGTSSGYFQGLLDEARIWNVARPQAEIRSTINSELTSASGLVARWGMNEGTGSTIASSIGVFPGTLTNNPLWGPGSPFDLVFDTTPPAKPTNLMSSARPGAVQLEWTANTETDLAGYRVYRSTNSPVVKGTPINGTLVAPSFIDSEVTAGTTYYYAVTAVDTSNNESPLSNETSAIPQTPPPAEALDLGTGHAYVALGDKADTSQFTLETWLRRDGPGVANTTGSNGETVVPLIANGAADQETVDADINYILGIRASDGVLCADFEEAQTGTTPGSNHPVCGTTPLANGTWYHAAVTYNGSTWQLYLNGSLERTLNAGQPANAGNISQLTFGTSMKTDNTPLGFFDGVLDEVRIWNTPRTQAQIISTINTKITTPQTGLIGRWGLDEASGAVVNDSSGGGITGTITGTGYSWVPGSPFNATVNLAPAAPTVVAPSNNATNIPTSTTLTVNVSDPENHPLDVTFYGRPRQSAAGPDFTLVVVPDPQYYAATYPSIYNAQMNWIVNNKSSNNIVYVASLGDNVDVASNATQWTNADAAWELLDAGNVPYGLAAGNHDGAPSGTASFNNYFGVSRFAGKSYYGGHYGSDNDNHYALFTASGLNFIVIFIEYDDAMTSTNHAVLQWANTLLQTHSNRRAIVVSHNMLQGGTSSSFTPQGQTIYNALKGNPNLFLMLGGHLDVASRRTDTFNGNTVYSLRSDYQSVDGQQSGYLRIMRFSPSDDMIYVRTYSPTQNKDYDKADAAQSNFNLSYAMDGTGFSVIGTANNVASGSSASVNWSGLNSGAQYEWFVIASDGTHQTSSDTWNFTTAATGNTPPEITEGASTNVTMSEDSSPTGFSLTLHAADANAGDTLTWNVSTPAAHGTASASGTGLTKSIGYIPTANYNGPDSFVVRVSDGHGGTDTITVNVTLQPVNDVPVAVIDSYTTLEGTTLNVTAPGVLGNDTDVDGNPLTAVKVTDPSHGTLTLNTNGSFVYTPAPLFSGTDSFTYKANDGTVASAPVAVSITVNPTNVAPVLSPIGNKTVSEGASLTFTATASDADGDTLTYSLDSGNPSGSSINPTTGVFTWTPTAAQGPNSYPITVRVSDGLLSDFETITVTVQDVLTPTTTTIASDTPDPSTVGQTVSVAVNVAAVPAGAPTPTGTVTVTGGVANCTIPLVNGAGSCNIAFDSVGTKTITATYNPATGFSGSSDTESHTVGETTSVEVHIGTNLAGTYPIAPSQSRRESFTGENNGPVKLVNTSAVPIIGAERVIYKVNGINTSFTEMMALPDSQLDTTYWLPWYNNVDLDTQLRFGNVSNSTATVRVFIGKDEMQGSPFTLLPGESTRQSFAGINNGPVKIVSNVPIVAAERVIYKVNGINTSFTEMMALPDSQLDSIYWLPWYNNVDLDTQLRFGNVSNSTATVRVFIGKDEMQGSPFTLLSGESTRQSFAGINTGPVRIVSNVPIVAAERIIYRANGIPTSFSETMGLPNRQLDTTYWLPWYNNVDLDTQLRFANVNATPATVRIYIGGQEVQGSPFTLLPGDSTRQSFAGINNGPVKIVSNVPIVAAERVIYKVNGINTSFSEMMALPDNLLDSIYWLPWYNNRDLDTQLRFGVPAR